MQTLSQGCAAEAEPDEYVLPRHHLDYAARDYFKSSRILIVAGLGCLHGDQNREIQATSPIRWILVPRASRAKLMDRSPHAGTVWCEVPAAPRETETHQTGSK